MINSKTFYDHIRKNIFSGSISTKQFQGVEAIFKEYSGLCVNDLRKLAYILATAFHETARTMQPVEEIGRGRTYDYGKKLKMGAGPGKRTPYTLPDKIYYGRGHTQNTWYENYQALTIAAKKQGKNWDFLNHPELLLQMEPSLWAMFYGMTTGLYTGRKLSDYFTSDRTDWYNARRIINGTDAAQKIAGIAQIFYNALIKE